MGITMFLKALLSSSSTTTAAATLTAIFALVVINLFIAQLRKTGSKSKQLPLPPGPAPLPVVGNIIELITNKPTFRWLHALMKQHNTEIACVRFGNVHVIPVISPKIGLEFLKEQDALFASRPPTMASSVLSRGYLTTAFQPPTNQWKKMRKLLSSEVISAARLNWLHDKRTAEADNLMKYVRNQSSSTGTVNIRTATRHYSGNVIRKMMFNKRYFGAGMEGGGPGVDEEAHVDALFGSLKYLYSFCVSDYFPFLVGFDLDGHEKGVEETYKTINKLHDPLIDERIEEWRNGGGDQKKEPQDLLDVLITLKDSDGNPLLSVEEIKAQILEFMMAAIDNPANAVEWAMAEMINQPALLQNAIEELDKVVGKERLVQESDIPHLNFLKACARESFRLHPVAPFNLPHVAMSDTTVAGYFIPKGSHVLLSRVGLGRNPKIWDDPLKFKPERHLTDECSDNVVLAEPNLRFISFSTGRRGCVGANLGTAMTTMLLARLIQGFSWSPLCDVSSIDLAESEDSLFLAKPLVAQAKPRLPHHLYPTI